MQQESQNNATGTIVDLHPLRIRVNSVSSEMLIEYSPDFGFNLIGLILLTLIMPFLFLIPENSELIMTIAFALVLWLVLVFYAFAKRKIRCAINKQTGVILYSRGGFFNTKFDEIESKFKIADVTNVEMIRHIRRHGDAFQIALKIKSWEEIELTGRSLNFSECQAYSEKIRNFIDPALPIKAID